MLFIDFEHLKIVKDFHFNTIEYNIDISNYKDATLSQIQKIARTLCSQMIEKSSLAVNYVINVIAESNSDPDFPDFILTTTNIILAEFFNAMITDEGWKREYRLDVPEKLKGLHANMSLIKKACNQKTINSIFNLTINWDDFFYYLCDKKDFKDDPEFVHSVEELETKDE